MYIYEVLFVFIYSCFYCDYCICNFLCYSNFLVPFYGAPTCAWFLILLSLYHTDTYYNNLRMCRSVMLRFCASFVFM